MVDHISIGVCCYRTHEVLNHSTDYVILRELFHLKEMNHSKHFYELMTRILPDWKDKRHTLNKSEVTW